MTSLTPERIAALRAKNAERGPLEWPDRYLVDELLDAVEAQQDEIERLTNELNVTLAIWKLLYGRDDELKQRLAAWAIDAAALREAVRDGA